MKNQIKLPTSASLSRRHCATFPQLAAGFFAITLTLFCVQVSAVTVPTAIFEQTFNSSAGLDIHAGSTLSDSNASVSKLPDDHALLNTTTGGLQTTFTADNLARFTVSGWYNASTAPTKGNRLLQGGDFEIYFESTGANANISIADKLVVKFGNGAIASIDGIAVSSFLKTNEWTFFAITYDSTTVRFYTATIDASIDNPVKEFSSGMSSKITSIGALTIGNYNGSSTSAQFQRGFIGSLDNIRIWDTTLSLDQLRAVRAADLINSAISVPEPATYALLAGLSLLAFVALLRIRR